MKRFLSFFFMLFAVVAVNAQTTFDLTVTNDKEDNAVVAGSTVDKLSWYFYAAGLPEGFQINRDNATVLKKDGEVFNAVQAGQMDATTGYWTFRNAAPEYIEEAGVYTMEIPAGVFFTEDEEGNVTSTSNAATFTWTVAAGAEKTPFDIESVTMSWMGEAIEAGAEVEALSYMYEVHTDKTLSAGEGHIEFKDAEGNGIGVATLVGNYLRFMNFGETGYTTPGTYTLTIPAGAVVDAEGNPCNAYTASWTVVSGAEKTPFDIESVTMSWMGEAIEAGAEVEALSYMYEVHTDKTLSAGEGHIEFKDAEGNGIGVATLAGNYLRFMNFGETGYTTPGTYTLTIPAGALVDAEGNPCNAYTASWTVKSTATGTFAISSVTFADVVAGSEVEALSYMATITTTNAVVALGEGNITLADAEGNLVGGNAYVYGYEGENGANTVYARFTFDSEDHQLRTPGVYTLNIPANMFVDAEGNKSEAYSASWTVLGSNTNNDVTLGEVTVVESEGAPRYFTTLNFTVPEEYVGMMCYTEGFMLEGDTTPFMIPEELLNEEGAIEITSTNVVIPVRDNKIAGETRLPGVYTAKTTVIVVDPANDFEEVYYANFTGSIVLPNINAVEIGTPVFNVADETVQVTTGYIEANGIVMTLDGAENITPDMMIKVVADLYTTVPQYGHDTEGDAGYTRPEFQMVLDNVEFTGDAMFGVPSVAMTEFAQYAIEAGEGNAFMINVKSIEVIGATGVEASMEINEENPVGCIFEVVAEGAFTDVVLGDAVINVDGMEISTNDVEANGIYVAFPDAQNVDETTEIKVVADLMVTLPGYGMGGDDVDGGYGVPQFVPALEDVEFTGSVDIETGAAMVPMTDFAQYVVEAGAGLYMINVKSIIVNGLDVYSCEDETAEPIGAMFAVTEAFEVEATAVVAQTEADQWGDQHYQVIVTVENSDNEITAAGVAYAYTEGVIFYDESTWSEFTFNCEALEGVEVVEDEDVVLVCTDSKVSQTTDNTFEGEIRAEGTYPAHCIVALVDANFNEVGSARFNGTLKLEKNIATGITSAKFNVTDVIYNIAGQKVNADAKGLVIKNGKVRIQK